MFEWGDPDEEAIDGFTYAEIEAFANDSVVTARCDRCGGTRKVEPDAEGYDCFDCEGVMSITSPLRKLGLI